MSDDVIDGEVISKNPSPEDVNTLLLRKIYDGIKNANKAEEILTWTEALSKYNTSIRNNDIFKEEDPESIQAQATKAAVADILKGKSNG